MKWITSILAILLFPFGYWICIYFYPNDTEKFFDLRMNLIALMCFFAFSSIYLWVEDRRAKMISGIAITLSIGDILDRFLFDCTSWQINDWFIMSFAVCFAFIEYFKFKMYDRITGDKG